MHENEISYVIRGCIFKVFGKLGPCIFESAYKTALEIEIRKEGLSVKREVTLSMIYEGIKADQANRLDMLVEGKVIVEVKSVENLHEIHHKQLLTYLKLSGLKLGILVNFNTVNIIKSIFRKVNGL